MSDDHNISKGDVFVDDHGDEFIVTDVKDSGEVYFDDYYQHWASEVQGFLDDGLWTRKSESDTDPASDADFVEVRRSDLDVLIYSLGLSQWLSPNADSEYAQESRKLTEGVYGALLTSRFDSRDSAPIEIIREARETRSYIFDRHFYADSTWGLVEYDTPDDLFDAVEIELAAHGVIPDDLPNRTRDYVDVPPVSEPERPARRDQQ